MKHDDGLTVEILQDPALENPYGLWVTSHSVVFDLENNTMSVAVFERFNQYYDYSAQ